MSNFQAFERKKRLTTGSLWDHLPKCFGGLGKPLLSYIQEVGQFGTLHLFFRMGRHGEVLLVTRYERLALRRLETFALFAQSVGHLYPQV